MCAGRGVRPQDKVRKQEVWIGSHGGGGYGGPGVNSMSGEHIPEGEGQQEGGAVAVALVPLNLSLDSAPGKHLGLSTFLFQARF